MKRRQELVEKAAAEFGEANAQITATVTENITNALVSEYLKKLVTDTTLVRLLGLTECAESVQALGGAGLRLMAANTGVKEAEENQDQVAIEGRRAERLQLHSEMSLLRGKVFDCLARAHREL